MGENVILRPKFLRITFKRDVITLESFDKVTMSELGTPSSIGCVEYFIRETEVTRDVDGAILIEGKLPEFEMKLSREDLSIVKDNPFSLIISKNSNVVSINF